MPDGLTMTAGASAAASRFHSCRDDSSCSIDINIADPLLVFMCCDVTWWSAALHTDQGMFSASYAQAVQIIPSTKPYTAALMRVFEVLAVCTVKRDRGSILSCKTK